MIQVWRLGSSLSESLYPVNKSLDEWATWSQLFVGSTSPNEGRYVATVDETISTKWVRFTGTSQPANWSAGVLLDLSSEAAPDAVITKFKADAQLGTATGGMVANAAQVLNVQRAAGPVTAGAPQQRHLENAGGDTLETIYEVHDGDA